MQTYDTYQHSGIDWLGEIPSHWECKRLGTWFSERRQKVSDKDYEPLSVTKNGIVPQLDNAAKSNDGDNRKLVLRGDFVINSRSDRKGSSGLSNLDGSVSLINIVMQPKGIYGAFTNYLLKSNSFIEEFYRNGHGIVADLWTTRYDEMKFIHLAIPPIHEQEAIAAFLDEKCGKIDALVEIKSQQIEKLKELRQVKIHQAVTKGLDANVALKDSGIDWIGDIPKHWEVSKVKNYLKIPITDGPHTTPELLDEGIPFISAEAIKNGKIDFSKKRGNISLNDYKIFSLKYIPKRNDIYMIKSGATTGNVAMVETDDIFTIWSPLAVFRVNHRVLARFLFNVLQSPYFKKSVELSWSFGTQQNIGMGVLGNLRVCIPPISEQKAIVAYLDEVTSQIDQALAQKQEQIEKLKQYKQSLINEVVTGKVRVC